MQEIQTDKDFEITVPIDDTTEPAAPERVDITGCLGQAIASSRRDGWERKLLDLTLRNPMLNLTPSKSIIPLWETDFAIIADHLKKNKVADLAGKQGEDNSESLKGIYRAARTSLEENGANSLFVTIGALRWFDVDDDRPHLAPLIFLPATIVRKKAMTYEIRLREDEPKVNVTLLEMLRQMFGITFPELDPLPMDADGFPKWQQVIEIFQDHIAEINKRQPAERQWQLPALAHVGVFSFTKFLMWNDLHAHSEVVDSHPVLRGLMENHYEDRPVEISAARLEAAAPTQFMLPIDYDSSQLEAVAEADAGNSFVLHGPPGTGKSQTITNMIANAIFHGKRVLFVAEKRAALEVVRTRLNQIGLAPYCLELHSNKTDKRSFFGQLEESNLKLIEQGGAPADTADRDMAATTLQAYRDTLNGVTRAIHAARKHGVSLYDCLSRFIENSYAGLTLAYEDVKHLSPGQVSTLCAELASLDLVESILGHHPSQSDLVGLYPRENTAQNQQGVTQTLRQMPDAIARAKAKAAGWINRWFLHKSSEQILQATPIWQDLHRLALTDAESVTTIDAAERSVNRWLNAIDDLRLWYHLSEKVNTIYNYDVPPVLKFYFAGKAGRETAKAVESGYYHALANYAIDNDSRLRGFTGMLHANRIDQYLNAVDAFQKQSRQTLLEGLESRLRTTHLEPEQAKQLALLNRRMLSNGRGVALRKVIAESQDVLQMAFPCMLMSPLSVAQYLDMRPDMFDLVIFDEASQMETPDAIGAIARGKALVVVGDPKQLPPTRFFTSMTSAGEEVEESEDADSILEDCIALGLPSRYLSRHYRSRHESLIAFSNANFYDNRLLTFPSCNDAERKVTLIDPSGVYDHGHSRTNRIEAEAVVAHIISLLKSSDSAPSIGVVAFSKAQSNLIEDLLNAKLQRNKPLLQKLDEAAEPIFIKNLENVQGDERDIIIFSIAYGPDAQGKVALNFGPLNQSGGERRLNVAVSRAREEMVVFSSLKAAHIPAEGIASKGVNALRRFLDFAANSSAAEPETDSPEMRETVIDDIAAHLRNRGLEVRTHVGRSSFKVDLAVVDPADPNRYRLGIIIDGRDYYALPTVRDREVTVPTVLRSLGWTLRHIWVIDWITNPDAIINQLLNELQSETVSANG